MLDSMPPELAGPASEVLFECRWNAPSECNDYLGLFEGPDLHEFQSGSVASVPVVYLFLANLRAHASDTPRRFREEVRITLLHELGHFLGWDEIDIAARGLD